MKPQTHYYREAVAKVAQAIDDALHVVVRRCDNDDELDLDDVLIPLAEARAYIIGAQLQANLADRMDAVLIDVKDDQPRVYADEVEKPKLPKLQPQGHSKDDKPRYKPGIMKLTKGAIEFDCPTCHAEHGTFCFKFEGPGAHPKLTTERNDGSFFHSKRQDLAKAYNDRVRKANILH